jgi:hypothetical protein
VRSQKRSGKCSRSSWRADAVNVDSDMDAGCDPSRPTAFDGLLKWAVHCIPDHCSSSSSSLSSSEFPCLPFSKGETKERKERCERKGRGWRKRRQKAGTINGKGLPLGVRRSSSWHFLISRPLPYTVSSVLLQSPSYILHYAPPFFHRNLIARGPWTSTPITTRSIDNSVHRYRPSLHQLPTFGILYGDQDAITPTARNLPPWPWPALSLSHRGYRQRHNHPGEREGRRRPVVHSLQRTIHPPCAHRRSSKGLVGYRLSCRRRLRTRSFLNKSETDPRYRHGHWRNAPSSFKRWYPVQPSLLGGGCEGELDWLLQWAWKLGQAGDDEPQAECGESTDTRAEVAYATCHLGEQRGEQGGESI